jgi:hypothetical protein
MGTAKEVEEGQDPLAPYQIPGLPSSFYYIHDFLSPAEADALLQKALQD